MAHRNTDRVLPNTFPFCQILSPFAAKWDLPTLATYLQDKGKGEVVPVLN
jgi:hypothetical protein